MTLEKAKAYIKRAGAIYGDSCKYEYGRWHHWITKFTSWEDAEKWLYTEQSDFRTRELISKTEARKYGYKE